VFDVLCRAVDENASVEGVFLTTIPKSKTTEILYLLEGGQPDTIKFTPIELSAALKVRKKHENNNNHAQKRGRGKGPRKTLGVVATAHSPSDPHRA